MAAGPVSRPRTWRLLPDEAALVAAYGYRCEIGRCREPVTLVTWRPWQSPVAGMVRASERFVCDQHGARFEQRPSRINPPPEREARRLSETERAGAFHCYAPGCPGLASVVFTERYAKRGFRQADEELTCDAHGAEVAARLPLEIGPAPDEGGAR